MGERKTNSWQVIQGDAVERLREIEDGSCHALVTDPPAGISFMSKGWDSDKGGRDQWIEWLTGVMREALRVLKPGAHALVWALPRTSHWTATAVEDAGFEIRDVISHLFGSGFPKSLDVSKAIDAASGVGREVDDYTGANFKNEVYGSAMGGGHTIARGTATTDAAKQWDGFGTALKPSTEFWILARKPLDGTVASNVQKWSTGGLNINATRVQNEEGGKGGSDCPKGERHEDGYMFGVRETVSDLVVETGQPQEASDLRLSVSQQIHDGFGESEVDRGDVARRSGLSLDTDEGRPADGASREDGQQDREAVAIVGGCASQERRSGGQSFIESQAVQQAGASRGGESRQALCRNGAVPSASSSGRWPPNLLLTHSALCDDAACRPCCPVFQIGEQSGEKTSGSRSAGVRKGMGFRGAGGDGGPAIDGDTGTAARFFPTFRYEPKPSTAERETGVEHMEKRTAGELTDRTDGTDGLKSPRAGAGRTSKGRANTHPTVKSVALMQWLCRLITPPGGTVLDCFCGSGSTGIAALREGFLFIGIEIDPAFVGIARNRIIGDAPLLNVGRESSLPPRGAKPKQDVLL